MKTNILIIILTAIIVVVSCTPVKPKTTEVIVLRDITEKSLANPSLSEILSAFDLQSNIWNGGIFYFENITDVSFNPVNEAKIPSKDKWLSNELARAKEIKAFTNKVSDILSTGQKDTVGKDGSSIYLPIARTVNQLAQSKSDKRMLVIYSDLMEHTKEMSFYNPKTMKQLRVKPEAILKQFEAAEPIQDLKGIEVYIIFQPKNEASDSDFKTVSEFYKKLLESKGATVTISASLVIE